MDRDLALIAAAAGVRASRELSDLMPLLAEHHPDDEALRFGIASVIAEIGTNVMAPAFAAHPDLETEFDRRIERYSRCI